MLMMRTDTKAVPSAVRDIEAEALIGEARARRRRRHRRNAAVLVAVVVVMVTGVVGYQRLGSHSTPTSIPSAGTIGSAWRTAGLTVWQHGLPSNDLALGPPTTISCAGRSRPACYVVVQANGIQPNGSRTIPGVDPGDSPGGSSAYRSTDGGSTWEQLAIPADTWLSSPIACSGPDTCAVGAIVDVGQAPGSSGKPVVLTTTDGGSTWIGHNLPASVGLVTDLACPTDSHCVGLALSDIDATIKGVQPYAGVYRFYPTSVFTTDNGGITWAESSVPRAAADVDDYLSSVSCPAVNQCVFVGESTTIVPHDGAYQTRGQAGLVLASRDGGRILTTSDRPAGIPTSLSCADASHCLILVETISGRNPWLVLAGSARRSWNSTTPTGLSSDVSGGFEAMSCPSAGQCVTTGSGAVATTRDNGRRWVVVDAVPPLPGDYRFDSVGPVACAESGICLVLDDMWLPPTTSNGTVGTRVLTNATVH